MKTKIFKHAALAAVILAGMGFSGFKAYDYSYAKRVNSDNAMLIANIEALTQDEDETWGYKPSYPPCPFPNDNQTATICGKIVKGGSFMDCMNSDCPF